MQQNTFFSDLVSKSLMDEWAKNIDWLLNDDKFNHWQKNDKIKYTRMIKDYLIKNNIDFQKLRIKELNCIKTPASNYIYINCSSSESMDIVRHIRNGIAHGHCSIKKLNNKSLYLIITDYTSNLEISAKMCVPIDLINQIRKIYKRVIAVKK